MIEGMKALMSLTLAACAVVMLLGLFSYYGVFGGTLVLLLLIAVLQ